MTATAAIPVKDHAVKQPHRIIIAGGGTGGHIFPAVAIANAIKKIAPGTEILFVGANGKMEMEKVPQAGYEIKGLDIAGYNRSSLIKNIFLPFKIIKSFYQVSKIVKSFRPSAVIGVGGYSSFPVLRYAQTKGIPSFIHESNSFAGKSNIMLGKKATKVFTATENMQRFFPQEKIVVTGNPVRKSIVDGQVSQKEALSFFGLAKDKITVLSIGGSLGAKSINEAIAYNFDLLELNDLQLIWQTGKSFLPTAQDIVKGNSGFFVSDFIIQMEYAYAAADIVISRSGAMAIAELCLVRKPVVLVPYPFAAEDHQTANAKELVNRKAALMITDNMAIEDLVPAIIELLDDTELQETMSANIGKLAIANADDIIAQQILDSIDHDGKSQTGSGI